MKEYFEIFLSFMRIGAFTFGGGYAMLPMIQREIVETRKWATYEEILDYFAVAQCTPGVIAVNTATFVGHKKKGVLGGIVATLGVVFVPVIIISVIATALKSISHLDAVQNALWGIRIAVCATITVSVISLLKKSVKGKLGIILFLLSLLAGIFLNLSPIITVVVAGITGIVANNIKKIMKKLQKYI